MICRSSDCMFPHHVIYDVVVGDNALAPNGGGGWPCTWTVFQSYSRSRAERFARSYNREHPGFTAWVAALHWQCTDPNVIRGHASLPRHTDPVELLRAEYARYRALLGLS